MVQMTHAESNIRVGQGRGMKLANYPEHPHNSLPVVLKLLNELSSSPVREGKHSNLCVVVNA